MFWANLKRNLVSGLRVAEAGEFSVSQAQVGALAATSVLVIFVLSLPLGDEEFVLHWPGLTSWAAIGFLVTIFILVVATVQGSQTLVFATQLLASAPWFLALVLLLSRFFPGAGWTVYLLTVLGVALVFIVVTRCFSFIKPSVIGFLLLIAVMIPTTDWRRFIKPAVFYTFQPVSFEKKKSVDAELVFRQQQALAAETLQQLTAQRPGHPDIYFVGFAGNGNEPVFDRDVAWVRAWFDDYLDTEGRSVVLSADAAGLDSRLMASPLNLQDILAGIGKKIDPNEDTVFLYLSSHGSADAYLDVAVSRMPLVNLTAARLRQALDDAGIRWRIIVISACYAGSFIDALVDEQTLVITAASADNTSFGCGWESEMTWFADAYFRQGLAEGYGLLDAFENARQIIEARELEEGIAASDPRIFIGKAIEKRLDAIETAVGLIE